MWRTRYLAHSTRGWKHSRRRQRSPRCNVSFSIRALLAHWPRLMPLAMLVQLVAWRAREHFLPLTPRTIRLLVLRKELPKKKPRSSQKWRRKKHSQLQHQEASSADGSKKGPKASQGLKGYLKPRSKLNLASSQWGCRGKQANPKKRKEWGWKASLRTRIRLEGRRDYLQRVRRHWQERTKWSRLPDWKTSVASFWIG